MRKLPTRLIAWILILLLAISVIVPAFAADAARIVTTVLGDGLTLTQTNSLLNGTRRQQFTLDYQPDGSFNIIWSSNRWTAAASSAKTTVSGSARMAYARSVSPD